MCPDDILSREPVRLDREFAELPLLTRLYIRLMGFFTGEGINKHTEKLLLRRMQRKIVRMEPGLVDYRRGLVHPHLFQIIEKLHSAVQVFRSPLTRVMAKEKPDFYALIGKLEFDDIHEKLENNTNPDKLVAEFPNLSVEEVKKKLRASLEEVLANIVPDRRKRMRLHTATLASMMTLVRFSYNRILKAFPVLTDGQMGSASLGEVKTPLMELGDALFGFHTSPSAILLEAMFLLELQDSIGNANHPLEQELTIRIDRAIAALDIIRNVHFDIPWLTLLKTLAGDVHYTPSSTRAGDDWFTIFKKFWENRLDIRYDAWFDRRRYLNIQESLAALWGMKAIPTVPGYRSVDFPDFAQPKHGASFAVVRVMLLDIFPGRLHYMLNRIKVEGKFYKKENSAEFERTFNHFIRSLDKIRSFEARISPEGDWGMRLASLNRGKEYGTDALTRFKEFVLLLDREGQGIVLPLINEMEVMLRLLKDILDSSGGAYDILSNMSEIAGKGSERFRKRLQNAVELIERSINLLTELISLEERLSFP